MLPLEKLVASPLALSTLIFSWEKEARKIAKTLPQNFNSEISTNLGRYNKPP